MSGPVSRPRADRERPVFEVTVRGGETFEAAVLRVATEDHPHREVIRSALERCVRAPAPPSSLHPLDAPELTMTERMSRLAESFPTLRGRPGIRPWDVDVVLEQLDAGWPGGGATHALRFVLAVWNPSMLLDNLARWLDAGEAFDVHRALGAWDDAHRAAFAAWATRPWWP